MVNLHAVAVFSGSADQEFFAHTVGSLGTSIVTNSGGSIWKPRPSCTSSDLYDVYYRSYVEESGCVRWCSHYSRVCLPRASGCGEGRGWVEHIAWVICSEVG